MLAWLTEADAGLDGGVDASCTVAQPSWQALDGGELFAGGFTDLVELPLGASLDLTLPREVIMTVCDDPLVEVQPSGGTIHLVGRRPGVTQCGFWYFKGSVPNRFARVSVRR